MFYDKDLMNSKSLGKAWRAGHGLNEESDEEASMKNICDKLNSWVDSSHEEPHRRLSLRTSSIFIDGAARLYKRKLELLFKDTQRLEKDMSRRKRFRGLFDDKSNISQTFTEPEFQDTTANTHLTENGMQTLESHLDDTTTNTDSERSNLNIWRDIQRTNTINQKSDKGVQTSPKKRRNNRRCEQHLPCLSSFDLNLPFGFVVVHDNYHSRIPSRIIFSSLSPDIGKLI